MQGANRSGPKIGAIVNGHILSVHGTWAPLNANANNGGPWYPGDIVNDCAFTGGAWIALPAGWRPDPTRRHEFRWWNGYAWTAHVIRNGVRFAEAAPVSVPPTRLVQQPPTVQKTAGFWDAVNTFGTIVDRLAFSGWVLFWLSLAAWSAWTSSQEGEPKLLGLTATASANVLSYKLTGTSWREFKKRLTKVPYVICGVVAAAGVWLSLHFDDPEILKVTMIVVLIGLMVSWVVS